MLCMTKVNFMNVNVSEVKENAEAAIEYFDSFFCYFFLTEG